MSTEAEHHGDQSAGRETTILITVALASMLAPLNSTLIGVALPEILDEFAIDLGSGSWLVIAYLITMASLGLVGGKLGDRFGRRRLILGGLVLFGIASLGAAIASSLTQLLIFRIQQAIAGAMIVPNCMALVREVVPAQRRASRMGLLGSAMVLAAAAGPPIAGVLIHLAGWRAVFYANVLLVVPALLLGLRTLPRHAGERGHRPFDVIGALHLLVILVVGAALMKGAIPSPPVVGPWGVAALLAVMVVHFLRREARHEDPIFQPRFFRSVTFASSCAAVALSNLAIYTTFLVIPLLLSDLPGWSSTEIGLVLTALWAPTMVCAPLGGKLADRWGRRWPTTLGMFLLTVGLASLAAWETGGDELWVLLGGLGIAGIGLGLSQAGTMTGILESVESTHSGSAAGIFSTSRYIGSIAGATALSILYSVGDEMMGFTRVLTMVVVSALAATLASLWMQHRPSPD